MSRNNYKIFLASVLSFVFFFSFFQSSQAGFFDWFRKNDPQSSQSTAAVVSSAKQYILSVSKSGSGVVTSDDGKINCGKQCKASFLANSKIVLKAEAGNNYKFERWNGCDKISDGKCQTTLNKSKMIVVKFASKIPVSSKKSSSSSARKASSSKSSSSNSSKASSSKSFSSNPTNKSSSLASKSSPSETLVIVSDSTMYMSAKEEIDRFVKDIQNDAVFNVELKTFPSGTSKETIKNYLNNLYFKNNLEVVIFIGEVPTAEYFPGSVSQIKVPTDSYYYDVYDKCLFNEQNQGFDSRNKFCDPIVLPFIISRITPPLKGADGIQLVKNYLNKNHAFRSGILSFDQKALLYPQTINDVATENRPATLENVIDNFRRFFAIDTLPIYGESELVIADWESNVNLPEPNKKFLEELSKNHQYAFIDAHGYPQGHLYNVNKDTIKNPNVFYADFYSCSVGKFTENDYIAGHYLFDGSTMFVRASSDVLFKPIGLVESEKLFLLKQGQTILETLKSLSPSFIIQNFGDPTLKMPQGIIQKNSKSKIFLDQQNINFGKIRTCKDIINYRDCNDSSGVKKITFNISNEGNDNLGFRISALPDFSFETINNSWPLDGYDKPYQITFDEVSFNVGANQKTSFTINMLGIVKGTYTGKMLIYNSDPLNPIIKVPFTVEITD